jgi:hypothetical protein
MQGEEFLKFELAIPECCQPFPGLFFGPGVLEQIRPGLFAFEKRRLARESASRNGFPARGHISPEIGSGHPNFLSADAESRFRRPKGGKILQVPVLVRLSTGHT